MLVSSALVLAGGMQLANAQPPGGGGGGGGRGMGMNMTFDALNTDKTPGTANDGEQVITVAELGAYFEQMMAGRGGGAPGGGAPGGGAPRAGGPGGGAPGGGAPGGRGGGFDPATMFGTWDTNSDGEITSAEFDARPQGGGQGRGGPGGAQGRGGPGGGAPGGPRAGGPPAQ